MGIEGLLEVLEPARIPNLKDVIPAAKHEYFAGKIAAAFGLAYNVEKFPEGVNSWFDLENPELKGKIAIPKWEWMGEQWIHLVNKAMGGTEDNIDPAIDWVAKLVKDYDAKIMNSTDHGLQLFSQEEIWAAPFWSARTYQVTSEGGPKMEFVYPEEGTLGLFFGTSLVKGRSEPSRKAAELLIDLQLDPELQSRFSQLCGYPPTNPRALDLIPDDAKEQKPALNVTRKDLESFSKVTFDYKKILENSDKNLRKWQERVLTG